MVTIVL